MPADFPPKLLLTTFAGFVNRDQSQLNADRLEENHVFRERQGNKRLRLTDRLCQVVTEDIAHSVAHCGLENP
tara:strand:+ start:10721 stop:10936 length:216 start_codon:yes stop_codon:yes gene_type:complete